MEPNDLEALVAGARWVGLSRGTKLTLRGSRPGQCWLMLTGYVKEHRPLDDGSEAVCGFRGPGDLVAEVGVLMARPSEHDVCDASDRVVLAILDLAHRWGVTTSEGIHIGIPLTQSELAEWIGTSRETTAKALHRLRREGLVATSRRRLIVQDVDGLRELVGLGHPDALAMPA